ncbi:uncharacterized protein LOC111137807 isoform X2 [Crassostrea virginica]
MNAGLFTKLEEFGKSILFRGISMYAGNEVDTCPETKAAWDQRSSSQSATCGGQSEYHCLQDKEGRRRELCLEKSRILEGNCPIVTEKGYLDWKPCNVSINGCPETHFVSNEVYQFPFCFGDNTPNPNRHKKREPEDGIPHVTIAVIVVVLIAVCGTVLGLFFYMRRKGSREHVDDPESKGLLLVEVREQSREEVVEDYHVEQGISVLQRNDTLLITGKLGSAVTSTAESIMKEFIKSGSEWKFRTHKYTDLPVEFESKTVNFVYGWFGLYNDDPCSVGKVVLQCKHISNAFKYKSKKHVKFIIGLRSDFHSLYHKELEQFNEDLLHYKVNLDSVDKRRDEGYVDHYEKKIKALCKISDCQCKTLKIDMLERKEIKIGIPLKLAILANDHELIPQFMAMKTFKKTLKTHFCSLKRSDEKLYQIIMYVCLKGELKRSEEVDKDIVGNLHFEITKENIGEKMETLEKYIRMRKSEKRQSVAPEKATYIFWHPFIYICAFHALFESNPDEVMTYCNIDAILQLVRPERENREDYFTVSASEARVKLFKSRLKPEELQDYAAHPLLAQ